MAAVSIRYAGHTEPGSRLATPSAVEWSVLWTAPAGAGPITCSAAANATDNDGSPLGD